MIEIRQYSFGKRPFTKTVTLPSSFKCLSIQLYRDELCFWALVDLDSADVRECKVELYCTNDSIENTARLSHVVTIQQDGYVWHLFERFSKERGSDANS